MAMLSAVVADSAVVHDGDTADELAAFNVIPTLQRQEKTILNYQSRGQRAAPIAQINVPITMELR